jgi:Ca-activated chloride channel homolog
MRFWKLYLLGLGAALIAGFALAQEGPIRDSGPTVARPKKPSSASPASEPELPKIPSRLNKAKTESTGQEPTFQSQVDLVTVDAAVLDSRGNFIPGIPAEKFRILENNVPQPIQKVEMGEAPMKVALVIEFSNLFQQMWGAGWYQTLQLAWGFAGSLKPEDYCAVIAFDIKPEILADFTTEKEKVREALDRLKIAAWSESNLYDALSDTADRMSGIEGRKAILLIASGRDTFSKINYDKARKTIQGAGVPIYAIGLLQMVRDMADAQGAMGSNTRMDFLQADNALRTFAKETGGQAFFPRFEGEYPGIFQTINGALRHQYVITYSPTNSAHDGTFRKIKVELVNPATNEPLVILDQNKKQVKYSVAAKSGYTAPRPVE